MSMKKIVSALLVLVLCLGLVACGNEPSTPSTTTASTTASTTTSTTTPPTKPTDEVVSLTTADEVIAAMSEEGKYQLANDITVDRGVNDSLPVLGVYADVTLDLNGYALNINQYAVGNVISIEGDACTAKLTLMDSSAEGKGVLRGVISAEYTGRDLIRVNKLENAQYFVMESGNLEYVLAEGIGAPASSIRIFNISGDEAIPSSATIKGGTVKCTISGATLDREGNLPPVIEGGSYTIDPTAFLAEGKTVTTETKDDVTWYVVN